MDPQACLERAYAAFAAGEWTELRTALGALARWIRKGGFVPESLAAQAPDALPRLVRLQKGVVWMRVQCKYCKDTGPLGDMEELEETNLWICDRCRCDADYGPLDDYHENEHW